MLATLLRLTSAHRFPFVTAVQVACAICVFGVLAGVGIRAHGSDSTGCCPGESQCEYLSTCFDHGYCLQGYRCDALCGVCDWVEGCSG